MSRVSCFFDSQCIQLAARKRVVYSGREIPVYIRTYVVSRDTGLIFTPFLRRRTRIVALSTATVSENECTAWDDAADRQRNFSSTPNPLPEGAVDPPPTHTHNVDLPSISIDIVFFVDT